MAKAKKQESAVSGATKKQATAAKTETKPKEIAKASAAKKSAPGGTPAVPMIDTNLAAAAAASMVLNRAVGAAPPAPAAAPDAAAGDAGDKRETSTFRQLKQGLAKPAGQGLGGILGAPQGGKKSNQPFGGGNQVRRNQTFGSDATRHNVPRRTGG